MNVSLTPELEQLLEKKAQQSGLDANAYVAKVLREALGLNGDGDAPSQQGTQPRELISERFRKIRQKLSAEERQALDELPSDFAAEHDHYIYGTPKKYSENAVRGHVVLDGGSGPQRRVARESGSL